MDEELRLWLAEQFKRDPEADPVFDKLWKMLETEEHVAAAKQMWVAGDEEQAAKKDFLKDARILLPYAEAQVGPARPVKTASKKTSRKDLLLKDDYEKERAEILGEYLAFRGMLHPLVRLFREKVLDGETLTPEQAYALVDSPAANRFPISRFEKEGIPVVGHTAEFIEHGVILKKTRMDKFIEYEYIYVDPPGEFFRAHLPVSVAYEDLEYLWFRGYQRTSNDSAYSSIRCRSEYTSTPVYPGSVLDNLRQLSQRLVAEYGRCWDEAQAAWFVLTDEPVAPRAITATYKDHGNEHFIHGTITLTVEPWVPSETVVKFYQRLQIDMLERKPRAPERRNLALFKFMTRQSKELLLGWESQGETPALPSSRELMERWNRENPDQSYTNESRFRRDFHRASRALLSPYNKSAVLQPLILTVP
jgi:hypothetical protein